MALTARGIGKPDYSEEISLGRERPGISIKYAQTLKNFSISHSDIESEYPYVTALLAAGASSHPIDGDTGLPMPYTVPKGYVLASVSVAYSISQDAIMRAYVDTELFANVGILVSGNMFYAAEVVGIGSHIVDPTGASSHIFDLTITNKGGDDLEGTIGCFFVLEAVGTEPLPTIKTIRCKFCGHEETVPRETTRRICTKCSKLNLYLDLSKFRGSL